MDNLMQVKSDIETIKENIEKAAQGYEPKCKICNSQFQDEIEEMYEQKHPFREITEFLYSKGENVSQMSLSRHFKKHYPVKKAYLDNIKNMEDKVIQKAIQDYPELKREFEDEEKYAASVFLNKKGYCLSRHCFCDNVPKREVMHAEDVISSFEYKLWEFRKYETILIPEKTVLLDKKLKCIECRHLENTVIMDYLIHAFTKSILGLDIGPEKFKEIFYYDAEWDFEEMDKILNQMKMDLKQFKDK